MQASPFIGPLEKRGQRLEEHAGPAAGHPGQLADLPVHLAVPGARVLVSGYHEADARGGRQVCAGKGCFSSRHTTSLQYNRHCIHFLVTGECKSAMASIHRGVTSCLNSSRQHQRWIASLMMPLSNQMLPALHCKHKANYSQSLDPAAFARLQDSWSDPSKALCILARSYRHQMMPPPPPPPPPRPPPPPPPHRPLTPSTMKMPTLLKDPVIFGPCTPSLILLTLMQFIQ